MHRRRRVLRRQAATCSRTACGGPRSRRGPARTKYPPAWRIAAALRCRTCELGAVPKFLWGPESCGPEIGDPVIERDLAHAIERGRGEWEDRLPLFRVAEYGF